MVIVGVARRNWIADLTESAARYNREAPDTVAGADRYDATPAAVRSLRKGLAPWVVRKVSTYIETHLESAIRAADLAAFGQAKYISLLQSIS